MEGSRRKFLVGLGPILGLISFGKVVEATPSDSPYENYFTWAVASSDIDSFADLKAKLDALPNQCMGLPQRVCETGERYVEIFEGALARPDDVVVVERNVARKMAQRISAVMEGRFGKIYWRIPFESEILNTQVVSNYDENGPDIDFITGKRCYVDKNWKAVKAYVRFTKAVT